MVTATCDRPAPPSGGMAASSRPATGQSPRESDATFVYARLHHFASICRHLSGDELTSFLTDARRVLSEPMLKLGGEIAQRRPDSVLAVFSNPPETRKPDHAQRGLHAAILAVYESVQLAHRVAAGLGASVPKLTLASGGNVGQAQISGRGRRSNG